MEELEDLLLEAAGRTGAPGRNRHSRPSSKRQREASYSDDGNGPSGDNSDDDLGYANSEPSGSQVPLKERLEPTEKDDDRGSLGDNGDYGDDNQDSSSDESDLGSDLYKDDYDREQLAQMTELEREMILSDRAQRRDDQRLTERVRAKQSGKKTQVVKDTPDLPSSRVRSSARFAERAASKDVALNELRTIRLKQQDSEGLRKMRDMSKEISVGSDTSPVRKKPTMSAQSSDSSQGGNLSQSHRRDKGSAGEEDSGDSDEERSNNEETLTLEDIKEITIRRSKLAKWLMEPFFEDLIVGCFVRVGIGKKDDRACYRLCIVKNVDATEPNKQYRLESKSTRKYLSVTWGRSEARWQMAVISESFPLEAEFNGWIQAMKRDGVRMPSRQDILEKQEAIQKVITFVYSSATVKQMLQEKKSASSRPLNIAAEKERLRRKMDVAASTQDRTEVERIKERLQELEAMSRKTKVKDFKAVRLDEMNKQNKAENFKNASQVKPVKTNLKAGEAGYDPFSRRWTRSRNYYVSNPGGGGEAAASANGDIATELGSGGCKGAAGVGGDTGVASLTTTEAALEAAADAGKLVDTNAPVDQGTESNSLHNFELSISLAELQRFGGAKGAHLGFMAKKQRIEAMIGCKVPENDGRMHSLTLTVSDYKRRSGLL